MDDRPQPIPLARLLALALRLVIDEVHEELAAAGHMVRPAHGFALVAVGEDGTTASRLASVLGITKQGAAKLVDSLVDLGYVARQPHTGDGRSRLLVLTGPGRDLLCRSVEIQRRVESRWTEVLGDHDAQIVRRSLERTVREAYGGSLPPVRPVW